MEIAIIGGGPGGYEAAIYAAKNGASVTLVEKGNVGGTCLNVGCIPTKALLASADTLHAAKNAKTFGVQVDGTPAADYAAVIGRKGKVVAALVKGIEQTLAANGVKLVRGVGSLVDAGTVQVTDAEGASQTLKADKIILATGSVPTTPGFLPVDGETIITSNEFLSLEAMPASMLIVGGGVIGCEIGQFLARMGCAVTIVELLPHILPMEDEDTAAALGRQFRRERIKTVCGNGIQSVEKVPEGVRATLADGTVLEAEKMLVSVGRRPYTEGLVLAAIGLAPDAKGCIPVDEWMQTTVPGVYAIGDIVDSPQLAHVATKEGFCAVDHMLGRPEKMNYAAVPRCVYTGPEVASVGVTEKELQEQGRTYHTGKFDFIALGKAKAAGKTDGFAKVLVDEEDRLVGAALVGAGATDMLAVLTLAVELGLTAKQVGNCIFPHPTMCEGIMEALHDVHGMSVHKL